MKKRLILVLSIVLAANYCFSQCKGIVETTDRFSGKTVKAGIVMELIQIMGVTKTSVNDSTSYLLSLSITLSSQMPDNAYNATEPMNIIYGDGSKETIPGSTFSHAPSMGNHYYTYTVQVTPEQLQKFKRLKITYLGNERLHAEFSKKTFKKQDEVITCILK